MTVKIIISLQKKDLDRINKYVEDNCMTRSKLFVRAVNDYMGDNVIDNRKIKGIWNNLSGVFNNER